MILVLICLVSWFFVVTLVFIVLLSRILVFVFTNFVSLICHVWILLSLCSVTIISSIITIMKFSKFSRILLLTFCRVFLFLISSPLYILFRKWIELVPIVLITIRLVLIRRLLVIICLPLLLLHIILYFISSLIIILNKSIKWPIH